MKLKTTNLKPLLDVAIFCAITYGFHEFWWWAAPWFKSTHAFQTAGSFMASQVFGGAAWFLHHILGWDFITLDPNVFIFNNAPTHLVQTQSYSHFPAPPGSGWQGYPSFFVNESCSGLKQFFQIIVLFLIFPGPWKHKLWFIPATIFVMHGVNISRIVILSVMVVYHPEYWGFTHDWILRPFFYVVIFCAWIVWLTCFKSKGLVNYTPPSVLDWSAPMEGRKAFHADGSNTDRSSDRLK